MKRLTTIVLLATLLLSSCSGEKWDISHDNMPEDLVQFNEDLLEEYLGYLDDEPYNKTYLFEVAFRYEQLGDAKKAIAYYEKVLDLDPDDRATINNLSHIYEEVGDYETAATYIVVLFNLDTGNPEVASDTVRVLLLAGFHEEALEALEMFASKVSGGEDEATTLMISDLFESIQDYQTENGIE